MIDICDLPLDEQLEHYRERFFDGNMALSAFNDLPDEQREHIVERCRELMMLLRYNHRQLGNIDLDEIKAA